jgi:hypothetical protein
MRSRQRGHGSDWLRSLSDLRPQGFERIWAPAPEANDPLV